MVILVETGGALVTDSNAPTVDKAVKPMHDNWLFSQLPAETLDSLNDDQRVAIHNTVSKAAQSHQPINLRVSIPFIKWRFFITIIGGEERRDSVRRTLERARNPLRTAGNIFFVVGMATLFYVAALFAVALHSAVIEF